MPNTVRTGYSTVFPLAGPSVRLKTNTTGTSLVFEVTAAAGASILLSYREAGSTNWSESDPLDSPDAGDLIPVSGLTEGETYQFAAIACSEPAGRGKRSAPGIILLAVPSSGSALEKIKNQIASELVSWVPSANIITGASLRGKLDMGQKAALITGKRTERTRFASGASYSRYEIEIRLYYQHRDDDEREKTLDSLSEDIASHFENNTAAFSGINGYFDTAAEKASRDSQNQSADRASVVLVCTVIN